MQNNMMIGPAKQQALQQINKYQRLMDIHQLERERLEHLIDSALKIENTENHWLKYERLKGMMSEFVGFGAQHVELATCQHYEIMLEFIEWLLPANRIKKLEQGRED